MGDSRIRYGLAYGRQNNFVTGSTDQTTRGYLAGTDGLFKQADTTPDVTNGVLFYTNNSAATTITHFDLQHPSSALVGSNSTNLSGLFEGKVIKVWFLDTATTVANSTRVVLSDSQNTTFGKDSFLELVYHTSSWYETSRSNVQFQATGYTGRVVTLGTSTSVTPITVRNTDQVIYLACTSLVVVVDGLAGGYEGQHVILAKYLANTGSSIKFSATNSSGIGNLYFGSTADFMLVVPATAGISAVEVVKAGTGWFIPTILTA